jgi:hypothetical protein
MCTPYVDQSRKHIVVAKRDSLHAFCLENVPRDMHEKNQTSQTASPVWLVGACPSEKELSERL